MVDKSCLCNCNIFLIVLFISLCLLFGIVKCDDFLTESTVEIPDSGSLTEILSSEHYVQEFVCNDNGLIQLRLYMATFSRKNRSHLYVSLKDENYDEIKSWDIDASLLKDNAYHTFALDRRIRDSKDKTYFLCIKSDAETGQGVTVYYNDDENALGLSLNGEKLDKQLCYQLVYKKTLHNSMGGGLKLQFLMSALLMVALFAVVYFVRDWSIEKKFLTIWTMLGLMYLLTLPLFRAPDEIAHFMRAYEVSQLDLLSELEESSGIGGSMLPLEGVDFSALKSWLSFWGNHKTIVLSENQVFKHFTNTAVYAPVSYLPQAFGMIILRAFTKNIAVLSYGGRVMNWFAITILMYFAIKVIPFGKEILAMIALVPMNVHESVTLAPDGVVVALSMLMLALVLHFRYARQDILKPWEVCSLYITAWAIGMLKIVYLPFGLLYCLIPKERFGGIRKKRVHIFAMALVSIASNLLWLSLCTDFLRIEATDASAQLSYSLHHLGTFMVVMARTFFSDLDIWATRMIGIDLSELNIRSVGFLIFAYLFMLVFRYIKNDRHSSDKTDREVNGICVLILVSIVLLIAASLYLQFTPVYNNIIVGIQGRYFIALLLPLYFAINKPSRLMVDREQNDISMREFGLIVCSNVCACIALFFSCM